MWKYEPILGSWVTGPAGERRCIGYVKITQTKWVAWDARGRKEITRYRRRMDIEAAKARLDAIGETATLAQAYDVLPHR